MRKSFVAFVLLFTLNAFSPSILAQDGLFAHFETSAGDFRVQLEFQRAPLTVANFVGLIEGSQKAVDPANGSIIEGGYYDGLIFHRVKPGFVIQGGSPTGIGSGGPGYRFPDEFHADLRHNRPFILSMANSGPNTNGSQFFITLAATPWLDQAHSVFGEVVEGSEVVQQISQVASVNERPIEDVIIHTITVQRIGEAALAFDPTSVNLPEPNIVAAELIHDDIDFYLDIPWKQNCDYQIFDTADLSQWTGRRIGLVGEILPPGPLKVTPFTAGASRKFFRVVEVQYSQVILTPATMRSSTLTLNVSEFAGVSTQSSIVYQFNNQGGGTAQRNDDEAVPISNYSYVANAPDRSTLIVPSDLIQPLDLVQLVLQFVSDTIGTFVGSLPTAMPNPTTMSGTFTLSRP